MTDRKVETTFPYSEGCQLLGTFYRKGKLYTHTQEAIQTNDHDFPSASTGVVPHGFYDLKRNYS